MKRSKVLLSTFGPLHLIKSAQYLSKYVDIVVIQGWIPKKKQKWVVKILSKIIGRDLMKSFVKRVPECLNGQNYGIASPEFCLWIGKVFSVFGNVFTPRFASKLFGKLSCKYIDNQYDIFHVRSGSGGVAIDYAKKLGLKVVVDHSIAHSFYIDDMLRPEYELFGLYCGYKSDFWLSLLEDCKKADMILVNSDFVKDTFVENGFNPDNIKVAYLGVREDFLRIKKTYQKGEKLKLLFTGGFGFRKGGLYILKALQKLDSLGVNYQFTVVGAYADEHEILEMYRPKEIDYKGFVPQDELKKYLSEYDIYLFPSLAEGCASSGMEAMAAGMPIITTRESGLPVTNNEDGIIIPVKDVDSIVESVIQLSENQDLRMRIGQNASNLIAKNYSWEHYAIHVANYYNDLINEKH